LGKCSPVITSMIEKIPSSMTRTAKNIIKKVNINSILIRKTYLARVNSEIRT